MKGFSQRWKMPELYTLQGRVRRTGMAGNSDNTAEQNAREQSDDCLQQHEGEGTSCPRAG